MLSVTLDPIIVVYFVYGLAFYTMGLALALEAGGRIADPDVRRAMGALAVFGILHGLHEWFEMLLKASEFASGGPPSLGVDALRVAALAVSFGALCVAGCSLVCSPGHVLYRRIAPLLFVVFAIGLGLMAPRIAPDWAALVRAADVWTRYSLGVSGAALTGAGLLARARAYAGQTPTAMRGMALAGCALFVYGLVGQSAPPPSVLFPSTVYNADTFARLFGFPIQLLRSAAAAVTMVGLLAALRALELERQRTLRAAIEARLAAQAQAQEEMARREVLQTELLRRTVATQEEERARIARELHDHTGQTLTALAYRAAALEPAIDGTNAAAQELVSDLRQLADQALADLRHMVTDLRPAQLDDLGLVAALHWLADQAHRRLGLEVTVEVEGRRARLPGEAETALFRIAQEAITNAARHAGVNHAQVCLEFAAEAVTLTVSDDGRGFDVEAVREDTRTPESVPWGLIGMEERAHVVGGELRLESAPGRGTTVSVVMPAPGEERDG